jgi:hypothetical protein
LNDTIEAGCLTVLSYNGSWNTYWNTNVGNNDTLERLVCASCDEANGWQWKEGDVMFASCECTNDDGCDTSFVNSTFCPDDLEELIFNGDCVSETSCIS